MTKQELRQQLRNARKSFPLAYQRDVALKVCTQLQNQSFMSQSEHLAIYLAFDGEVSMQETCEWAWEHDKKVYLPILDPNQEGRLLFQRYTDKSRMTRNKFGIEEPIIDYDSTVLPNTLDVICAPLVGFDQNCMRFGMGGGYYDRTLSDLVAKPHRPIYVGIAHSVQQVANLPTAPWDIPMDYIITEQKVFVRQTP